MVINHLYKNTNAETRALIELYWEDKDPELLIKAHQNTGKMIRSTELRLNLYKIELGVYKAKPKEIKVKEFVKDFLPKGSVLNYFAPMWLKIKEHILLTFFLSVVADNMRSHGVAPFLVDIVYHKGTLRLMFTNHVPKAGAPREHDSLNYHSTGFGLNDIQRISTLRSVDLFLSSSSQPRRQYLEI